MTTKHTPGPLSVSFGTKWPFEILISNELGAVVYRQSLPCHSSKDKNFEEALNCWNFKASEQEEYAAINHRAVANARLIAAAPDLLKALQWYEAKAVQMGRAAIHQDSKLMLALMKEIAVEYGAQARAAIAKATGEQP